MGARRACVSHALLNTLSINMYMANMADALLVIAEHHAMDTSVADA